MTHYPNSVSKPVPSHGGPMTEHLGLCLHVTTNSGDPYNYFHNPADKASSNWWVSDTGAVEEYVDPDNAAWAQAAGNHTYNSVETSGLASEAMTPAQVEAVAHLYAWGHAHYGWPFTLADKPGDKGLGWHGMGGAAWGGHLGCPGDKRKAQRLAILKRALQLATPAKATPYHYTHLPLTEGNRNVDVAHVQKQLHLTVDGVFGPATKTAVVNFQKAHHLTPDGVVGPATAKALG